ncbi:MAG: membrane protein insertion efficiency factor YidD [Candidatus Peribacteria bacterium]|jgi:putative component of membrane protein insertase Oxa1/YidC/SpoIIIJ protein YidD|nr:membrane protein insertion efficiency factor YidD [Candidatus Peribacteria bacterium]
MKKVLKILDNFLAKVSIGSIKLYQRTLSPDKGILSPMLKGKVCSHEPHCSEYAIKTLKRYGFRYGIGKATDRILHCTPKMHKLYDPEHYRVVFFSSAEIGVPFLEELAKDQRFEIVGVVTQADKPVGRGLHLQENIIKTKAKEL